MIRFSSVHFGFAMSRPKPEPNIFNFGFFVSISFVFLFSSAQYGLAVRFSSSPQHPGYEYKTTREGAC